MAGSGEVVAITGSAQAVTQVFVVKANGQKIPLKIGDTVDPGDVVITPAGVQVEVRVDNGQVISIDGGQTVAMTAELLENGTPDAQSASSDGAAIQSVIQAINEGRDIGDVLEETAAGGNGGSGNEGGNDEVINLVRVIEQGGSPIEYSYQTDTTTETVPPLFSLPVEGPLADATPPAAAPFIGIDNVGTITGQITAGSSTDDNLPEIKGTGATPGDTIQVFDNGVLLVGPPAIVQPDGSWTFTPTTPLADGPHSITTTATDPAGNISPPSTALPFTVDTSIPNGGLAPTVVITDDVNNDGFVNLVESTADGNTVTDVRIGFDGTKVDVGDIVVATSGGVSKEITITATDKAAGFVTTTYPSPVDGTSIKVDAFIKDVAGNQSATGTDTAKYDLSTLAGIAIAITEDTNNDGVINATELQGTIGVRVALPATAVAGDLLTVTGTGAATQTVTLTAANVATGNVTLEFAAPANGTTFVTTAQVTDPAGNESATVTDSAVIDTDPVNAPTVTITEDANNDGYINAAELQGDIGTTVGLPPGAVAGDSLVVTVNGVARPPIVLTPAQIATGTVSIPGITSPGEGQPLLVEARVDDQAGNTGATGSDSAIVDTSNLNLGLAVTITEDTNNDGFINATELQGNTVGVRVTLPAGAAVGDTVTISASGNVDQTVTVTAAQITAGFIDVDFNPTGNNTTFTATATIKDVAGNAGGPVSDQATIQLTLAGAPIVNIAEDANNDGYINAAELNGPIDVSITLPATVNVGDSLIVTINGTPQAPIVLTLAQVQASSVSITAANPGEGATLTVDARVVDAAGNVGNTGSDSAIIDTSIPNGGLAPTVVITDDVNNDGFVNLVESTADGNTVTDVRIGFDGTKVDVGDIVVATSGGVSKEITITATDKAAGFVTTTYPSPVDGTSIKVDAFIKDVAGNQSATGTDTAKYDLSTLAGIAIEITEDANNDGFINATELQGTIGVRITLPATAVAGDLLTVTGTGSATQAVTLTAAQVTAGSVTLEFPAPANGTTFEATAQVTDPAGNQSLVVRDSAVIDTNPVGAPIVTITEDANNDGYINAAELNGNIDTTVRLPATALAGDSLIVTVNGVAQPARVLTAADITAGTLSIPGITSPGEGATLLVEARVDTVAGNIGATGSDSAIVDTSNLNLGLAVTITEDTNNDGFINSTELQGNTIGVRVTLPGQVAVGDTVTVKASGNVDQVFTVTAAQVTAGFIDVDFNPTGDNTTFTATATIRDVAGNTGGPVNDQATIQLTIAGAPIVTISEDANNDGYINAAELNGPINVSITLPSTVNVGDSLITTINGVEQPPIVLTLAQVQASSVSITAANPGEGATLTVDARVVDVAGNVGNTGSDSAIIDTTPPDANAISGVLPETAIDDTGLSNTDNITANRTPTLTGTTELATDRVEVTVNGVTYIATVTPDPVNPAKGVWSVPVTTSLPNGTITPSIKVTDLAGNTTTKNGEIFTVVPPTATANVSEEGLPGGNPDNVGNTDTTNLTIASGNMNVNVGTVTFTAPTDALSSDGVAVTWTGSGTNTLVGSAGGAEVIRATVDNNGNYTVTLSKAVDHAGIGVEDVKTLGLGVVVTSASGATNTGTLTVNIEDDSPVAETTTATLTSQDANTNLSIILDLSGSMDNASGLTNVSRLDVTKAAVKELIDGYDSYGNVMVNITVFGSTASTTAGGVWVSAANAIAFIDTLSANLGGTNYDAALAEAISNFAEAGKLTAADAQNILYFLSDGQPQTGDGNNNALLNVNGGSAGADINAAETTIWQNFLNANKINAFAFGIGTGVTADAMNPVAYNGSTGTDRNAEVITDLNGLSDRLASTVIISTAGNLSTSGTIATDFGADGGFLSQLVFGNNTFNYNATLNTVTRTGAGTTAFTYNQGTNILTLTTLGGSYELNMLTGAYNYITTASTSGVSQETFGFTLSDNDGDTNNGVLTVNLGDFKTTPVASDDNILVQLSNGNGGSVTVKDAWLLWNDSDRDGDPLTISSVTNATSHTNGEVVDSLTGSNNSRTGSFNYEASDPDGNTNPAVARITVNSSSTLNGNGLDNILIGGNGNNTINGNEGDDVLVGNGGNDTLNGGAGRDLLIGGTGNDTLTGGTGADVFKWELGDNGTTASPATDVITDFNVAQGDVLNLKDLLIGENAGNLTNFLHFEQSGANTTLFVSHNGGFTNGVFNTNADTQIITLNNVSLTDLGGANDAAIIQNLLANNQLIVDQ